MLYIKLIGELLAFESAKCTEQRLAGKFIIKPSSIFILLFVFLYAVSPVDFIPERFINSWIAYIDDVIVCAAAACYVVSDITSAIEGRKLGAAEKRGDAADNSNQK